MKNFAEINRALAAKKKFIFIIIALVISAATKALEVGDFYVDNSNGVPAIVVYLDESGEHGLLMAPLYFTNDEFNKMVKSTEEQIRAISPENAQQPTKKKGGLFGMSDKIKQNVMKSTASAGIGEEGVLQQKASIIAFRKTTDFIEKYPKPESWKEHDKEYNNKLFKSYIDSLVAYNSGFGETNTKSILDFCTAKNIDTDLYFPIFNYANSLGDGWFVAGNHELELISKNFITSLGKENAENSDEVFNKRKKLVRKLGFLSHCFADFEKPIYSSTMVESSWKETHQDIIEKIVFTGSNTGLGPLGQLIVATVSLSVKDTYYALLQKDPGLATKYYYTFVSNWDGAGQLITVKYF